MKATPLIRCERHAHIATLTLNRPESLNALNAGMLASLNAQLGELAQHDTPRALILTGEGKAFVAGGDIRAMQSMNPAEAKAFAEQGHAVLQMLTEAPYPVIAAINGFALGGGLELALACDMIIAAEEAKLGLPEVTLGVIPGFGGTFRLAQRVGLARARALMLSAEVFDAQRAHQLGIIDELLPKDELMPRAQAIATGLSKHAPCALKQIKTLSISLSGTRTETRAAQEIDAFARCFATHDQREGMDAFLNKRPAQFKGH